MEPAEPEQTSSSPYNIANRELVSSTVSANCSVSIPDTGTVAPQLAARDSWDGHSSMACKVCREFRSDRSDHPSDTRDRENGRDLSLAAGTGCPTGALLELAIIPWNDMPFVQNRRQLGDSDWVLNRDYWLSRSAEHLPFHINTSESGKHVRLRASSRGRQLQRLQQSITSCV